MVRAAVVMVPLAMIGLALGVAGCQQQSSTAPQQTGGDTAGHADDSQPAETGADVAADQQQEQAEALAQLSPADRALADKQKVCPVTGEPLGSMGTPYKVTVKGQEVLLCCKGCEMEIMENPDKYLAKLNP